MTVKRFDGSAAVGIPSMVSNSGKYLTNNGTRTSWADLPISTAGLTLIQRTQAAGSMITFSSIPTTYKQLYLVWSGITGTSTYDVRFNNDSGSNYTANYVLFNQTTVTHQGDDINTSLMSARSNWAVFGNSPSGSSANDVSAKGWLLIDGYSSSMFKIITGQWAFKNGGSIPNAAPYYQGLYKSTTPITSINIVNIGGGGSFSNNANTYISLYGVA